MGFEGEKGAGERAFLFGVCSWLGGSGGRGKLIAPLPCAFQLRRRSHASLVRALADDTGKLARAFGNPPRSVDHRPVLVRAYLAFERAPVAAAIRTFIQVVAPLLAIAANDIGAAPVCDPSSIPVRVG